MSWIDNLRPKIRALYKREVPDNLWIKCPSCGSMLFHRDLDANDRVCSECGHHMRLTARQRLDLLFDDERYETIELPTVPADPLRFRDKRKYSDRMREAQSKTGMADAILVGHGKIGGQPAVVAAFAFEFMGGSMGMAVGEALVAAAKLAVLQDAALIAVPASGGARMQEGILSLMQMPRSVVAVQLVREANLPYIVVLTDPTTGGVSASFAMLGDIQIAEPGAQIGFAGKRVIEETIREKLPPGFQTAESLLEHGAVDMVVPRHELASTIGHLLTLLRVPVVEPMATPADDPVELESLPTEGALTNGAMDASGHHEPEVEAEEEPAQIAAPETTEGQEPRDGA